MSAAAGAPVVPSAARVPRAWAVTGALAVTETVSWGVVYYAFAVFLVPMRADTGWSEAQLTGAFSLALLVSAIAGVAAGHWLDRHGPRGLMTAGSIAATALVALWSQAGDLAAYYAIWAGLGLVMAAVLYEPAFVVLAKSFDDARERRRAMTAMTLVAACASFIFLPLSQHLIAAHGWRDALLVLAVVLGAVTIPLHALVLRTPARPARAPAASAPAGAVLRSRSFWLLAAGFALASFTAVAAVVYAIPYLVGRGHSPAFAAFAVGLAGISQIPGRLLFAPVAARLPPSLATAWVFALIALGLVVLALAPGRGGTLTGLVLLGMGNGMATLARATSLAERYGPAAYGTIAGVAATTTTVARAAGPVAAAVFAAAAGATALIWTLALLAAVAAGLARAADTARAPWLSPAGCSG